MKNITALALSPDGQHIAFVVREASLADDKYKNTLWIMPANNGSAPRQVLDGCDSPQWSQDSQELACIAPRAGRPQIVVFNAASLAVDLESSAPDGVVSFQWSPTGREIAFLSRQAGAAAPAGNWQRGVVIDKRTSVVYTLLANDLFIDLTRPVHLYLLKLGTKSVDNLITSFDVEAASWSPDGQTLAVTGKERPELGYPESVYLYSLASKQATRILQGVEQNHFPTQQYARPTWSPDGSALAAVSTTSEDRWANSGSIGIYSLQTGTFRLITDEDHLQLYQARFFWLDKSAITFENTVRASTQLFRLSLEGKTNALTNFDGENSLFSLSADSRRAAFVHQSFQHPPEVYTSNSPFRDSTKLTALNATSDRSAVPPAEQIHWAGAGGVTVEGWLIKPPDYRAGRRYPLLVMVHGGPGVAITDSFEPYSLFGQWAWPYPFRIFAERGYLVFIPNYRGTGSYGKQFEMFRDMAGEPADDIVAGVNFLIQRGDADPSLVGILGQSHGAWLGPYVLTHHKAMFKAASFAEGALDAISQYGQMPGWLNLYTHEFYNPGNPYDNLQRLIAISPIFDMKGLEAPTLLEFGQRSLAVLGLESVTALWREGVPHEMIVYPKEGHNLASPVNQLESMHRNLDWFDYWMLGRQNPDPKQKDQYLRWQEMTREMKAMRDYNAEHPAGR
ncbi:MAG TPA: prolyl oligopeptidase family serine peptidase [Bryobacteraceae bacterium]|nr:prolyl oligopeptidase family serine peptidase [Bryobacteraceae bacterium]